MKFATRWVIATLTALMLCAGGLQAAEPRRGGSLIIGVEGEPATATAHLATDTAALMVASNLFSGLIQLDFNFQPQPDLAQSWTISEDGRVYRFNLVKNATWHDGRPVTAADVEFTFNEILAKVHPRASSWMSTIESARALDDHTFEMRLKQSYAPMMAVLGNVLGSGTLIMPKHIYQGTDPKANPANRAPIGSGPFRFAKWEKGQFIELTRNEKYFKPGKPYLDRVVIQFVPDAAARMLAFERGDIDFLHWYIVPYDRVGKMRQDKRFRVVERGGEGAATNEYLLFNLRNKPLSDIRVRRAIALAIDRNQIVKSALFGEGKVANSFINSGLGWIFDPSPDVYRKPDIARANALLDEAGFARGANGQRFSLRVAWATGRDYEGRAAELIRNNLRQVGIDVRIETLDRTSFITKVFGNWDFDMAHQLFTTGPDPTISVTPRYHSNQIKKVPFVNAMGYANAELDKLFDADPGEQDRAKRVAIWKRAQKILMDDLPALPLFEVPVLNLVSAKFEDVITNPFGYIQSREGTHAVR